MKTRKILLIILLFSSLISLSACSEFIDYNTKINNLQSQLNQSEEENEQLEEQIAELNSKIEELGLIEESLTNSSLELEDNILTLENENQVLKEEVILYEQRLNALKNQTETIGDYEDEIVTLNDEINSLNLKINENDLMIADLQSIVSKVQTQKATLELEILELVSQKNNLTNQIDNLFQLFNDVSYNAMQANVKIIVEHTNKFGNGIASVGSGVIIYEDATKYYVLTNNHVVYDEPDYIGIKYTVYDYKGNQHSAGVYAKDPNYDLALIYFSKGKEVLNKLNFAQSDPVVDDLVISIGQPEGQFNTISFGDVLNYQKVYLDSGEDFSNVQFNVIKHSSPINSGSSGGVLIDAQLNIVGINYAGIKTSDGPSNYGYAIPISKVREFLIYNDFYMN